MKSRIHIILLALLALLTMLPVAQAEAAMADYCIVPPYVMRDIQPNVMIVLDNAEINGEAAYMSLRPDDAGYFMPTNPKLAAGSIFTYNPEQFYDGIFVPTVWYYYDGNGFVPQVLDNSVNGKKSVFEGNLLNWVTTSRYDLIMKILVGGKSASRQPANYNTLIGINSGVWEQRIYHYLGEDGNRYTCTFQANVGDKGDLTIAESAIYYKSGDIYEGTCGLILSTPVRPVWKDGLGVRYRYNQTRAGSIMDQYADAREDTPAWALRVVYGAINAVMGVLATEADAAPLKIFSPKSDGDILTDAKLGFAYNYVPVGTGGSGNYEWSALASTGPWNGLPAGLTVNPVTGAIAGIPAGPSNDVVHPYYDFTLRLTDTASGTAVDRLLKIKVTGSVLKIVSPTVNLDAGQRFTLYNKDKWFYCQADGGNPFISTDFAVTRVDVGVKYYEWTASGLPAGLTIHPYQGRISGYLYGAEGTYSVTLTAKDADGTVVTLTVPMEVYGMKVSILTPPDGGKLPNAVRFNAYSGAQAIGSGGTSPYTWSMTGPVSGVNTFPNISISAVTGAISVTGVVTAKPGDYTTTITVTDAVGATATSTVTLTVEGNALTVTKPDLDYVDLPSAEMLKAYVGYTPQAAYGSGTYTWTVTGLPAGMGYSAVTGKISGTPAAVQTTGGVSPKYTLLFKVTDTVSGETATRYAYLDLTPSPVTITWPSIDLFDIGDTIRLDVYTNRFQALAQGGFGPYTWSMVNAPTGLNINPTTGVISGKPTGVTDQRYKAIISVSDGYTSDKVPVYIWEYYEAPIDIINVSDGVAMDAGQVGVVYGGFSVGTWGGYGQNTWLITGLPPGLTYNALSGLVSGTPTVAGTYTVTFKVDSGLTTDTVWLTLTINPASAPPAPSIQYPTAGNPLPEGTQSKVYGPIQLEATGGTPGYTWSSPSGLPAGLTLSATGVISGTPTVPGWYTITIQVKDSAGQIDIHSVNLDIYSNAVKIQSPSTLTDMPSAFYKYDYMGPDSFKVAALHGSGTYTWTVTGLPAGLTFDSVTGTIDGTSTVYTSANYSVTVSVKDLVYGYTDTVVVTLPTVGIFDFTYVSPTGAAVIDIPYPPEYNAATGVGYYESVVGAYWAISPVVLGGTPPYTWTVTGVTRGLTLTSGGAETGHIRGYPLDTWGADYTMTFTVTDANGMSATRNIFLHLTPVTLLKSAFNIRVCAGDYVDNCNTTPPAKSGLLNEKWSEARWGFTDFDNAGAPAVTCLPQTNEPSFFTAVENAVPVGVFTELVNAIYESMQMYRGDSAPSCDPFAGDESPCRRNFILMLTDGSGADNPPVPSGTAPSVFGAADTPPMPDVCAALPYTLAKNACYGYVNDLRPDLEGNQSVSTYIVSAMGTNDAILQSAADASDGLFYKANDPSELARQIAQALEDIIKRAASGTAASVLASGQGTGANLIQALYFPRREFVDVSTGTKDQISWVGMISDFWYYVDPRFRYNSIREETVQSNPPVLNLVEDYAINMFFNTTSEVVEAARYRDTDADGNADVYVDTVDFNEVNSIWEVGQSLWERDLTTNPRTIYTSVDGQNLIAFTNTTARANATLRQYMDATDVDHADDIARWIHGEDIGGYRSRTVSADASGVKRVWKLGDILNSTPKIVSSDMNNPSYERCFGPADLYTKHSYGSFLLSDVYRRRGVVYAGGNDGMLHAFYLGVMNVGEWAGHNAADRARLENDLAGSGVELGDELWSYIPKNALPYLKYQMEGDYCHLYTVDMTPYVVDAMVVADTASPELADLPDLLPIAAAGQQSSTCTPGTYEECRATIHSWRTILIGGMRYGGACEPVTTGNCPVDLNGDGDLTNDCVKAPIADVGFSSYFALDITDTTAPPKLLWEFTHPDLGFSTTGPAIVRLQPKTSGGQISDAKTGMFNLNGKWYVVFGSGPTGPIKKSTKQFMAQSDQNLRFFVFDVYLGPGAGNADVTVIDSGIPKAFAGSMIDTTVDRNLGGGLCTGPLKDPADFVDDALYVGYVTPETNDSLDANLDGAPAVMWNNGGIGRLTFHTDLNPANWEFATLMENVGPVTSAPTHMARKKTPTISELWVFGASGRYYFLDTDDPDDSQTPGNVVGFVDPCYNGAAGGLSPYDAGCTTKVSMAGLADVTTDLNAGKGGIGWRLTLDAPYTYTNPVTGKALSFYAERVITDLVASTREGRVYVTAMKPYSDICSIGGVSSIWVFDASSGGAPGQMKGTAIVQVSTGSIEQIDLADAFDPTDAATRGGRRTSFMIEGLPPMMQGMSMFSPPPPAPRIMHLIQKTQERLP